MSSQGRKLLNSANRVSGRPIVSKGFGDSREEGYNGERSPKDRIRRPRSGGTQEHVQSSEQRMPHCKPGEEAEDHGHLRETRKEDLAGGDQLAGDGLGAGRRVIGRRDSLLEGLHWEFQAPQEVRWYKQGSDHFEWRRIGTGR